MTREDLSDPTWPVTEDGRLAGTPGFIAPERLMAAGWTPALLAAKAAEWERAHGDSSTGTLTHDPSSWVSDDDATVTKVAP